MSIYIYKSNQQTGPFEESAVLEWLKTGQLSGEDFGCRTGAKEWQSLKILFANNPAQPVNDLNVAPNNAVNGGQEFYNQPVVNWARQTLQTPVEIKLRYNSPIFIGVLFAILGIFFLGLPGAIFISGIYKLITEGWGEALGGGLTLGTILLVVSGGFFLLLVLLRKMQRRKIAAVLISEGVQTTGGQKYLWENLYFLDYKQLNTRTTGNLTASLTKEVMYAGVKKITVELVFAKGKAVITPLISNQSEILGLLETIPVERRENGKIRQ